MKYSYEYKKECVELYREGKWAETPIGLKERAFHYTIWKWARIADSCGLEALRCKERYKKWTPEEKYALVAKVLAGASYKNTAFQAGISDALLHRWTKAYIIKGYDGLVAQRKGRPPKEPQMKKKELSSELTPSEREEIIRLKAEIEYLRAENEVIKKEIALREEKRAAQLKARKQRLSKNSEKKDIP